MQQIGVVREDSGLVLAALHLLLEKVMQVL